MKTYETLSEAINSLMKQGYTHNFNIEGTQLENSLQADEFVIDEIQRFEGMNDPGDSNILFAISARHQNLKGLLVNAYGAYADTYSSMVTQNLSSPNQSV